MIPRRLNSAMAEISQAVALLAGNPFARMGALGWNPRRTASDSKVLFLTFGDNPSFDYYFRSRLEISAPFAHAIVDTRRQGPDEIDWRGTHVVICRYLAAPWRAMLEAKAGQLAGLSLFLDDDMPALVSDRVLPLSYRYRVARDGLALWPIVARAGGRMLVSTPELAARYHMAQPLVLTPVTAACDLPGTTSEAVPKVIFHATDSHRHEHVLAADIARRLTIDAPHIRFDVVASARTRALWRGLPNVDIRPPVTWPEYRALGTGMQGGILIAPLIDTALNRARSATKAIDAVRFGAAGLFGNLAPYRDLGDIATLLPPDPSRWAEAIVTLAADSALWRANRDSLHRRVSSWRQPPVWPKHWDPASRVHP